MNKIKIILPVEPGQSLSIFSASGSAVWHTLDSTLPVTETSFTANDDGTVELWPEQTDHLSQQISPVFVRGEQVLVDDSGLLWAESECIALPEDDYGDVQVDRFLEEAGIEKRSRSHVVVEPNGSFSLALVRYGEAFHLGYFDSYGDVLTYSEAMRSGDADFSLEAAGFDLEYDDSTDMLLCVEVNDLGMTRFHSV